MVRKSLLQYNKENLDKVSESIKKNLTPDLLPRYMRPRNASNPMFGHCHTASGVLYKIFGPSSLHMHRALDDEGIYHWWVVDRETKDIIDLTRDQYDSTGRIPPYKSGEKSSMLGFDYRKRVETLLERVKSDLDL